jgi:16S rRNA (cytidine1402-2'-O)-methyltransferase
VSGRLSVVATPIGNLEDITYRAVRILGEVDLIAAEDTRSARKLLGRYGVAKETVSVFSGNEARRAEEILARLDAGEHVALISESGMPGVSDPGERLIRRCIEAGIEVDVIPGPSAVTTALVISGLPSGRFTFLGFLPRAGRRRREVLEQLRFEPGTLVLYESPRRVSQTLDDLFSALGEREAALARELTKRHQEVIRAPLSALGERFEDQPARGEVTLVIGPSDEGAALPGEALDNEILERLQRGESPARIAGELGVHGKRKVYQRALTLRDRDD